MPKGKSKPLTHTVHSAEQTNCSLSHFSSSNCSHSMLFATLTAFLEIPSNESKLQLGECVFLHSVGEVSPADLVLAMLRGRTFSGRGGCAWLQKSSRMFFRLHLLLLFRVVCEHGP